MVKNRENNGTEEIGQVTPTTDVINLSLLTAYTTGHKLTRKFNAWSIKT